MFSLYRHETFNEPLDPAFWRIEDRDAGNWGTQAESYPVASNVVVDTKLHLKAKRLALPEPKPGSTHVYKYTDARISTRDRWLTRYGAFEASIKIPHSKSLWSTFWLRPADELHTPDEIDIIEYWSNNKLLLNLHGPRKDGSDTWQSADNSIVKPSDFFNSFHTYRLEWIPGNMKWYLDGVMLRTKDAYPDGYWKMWPFDTDELYVVFNIKVGGQAGAVDSTTLDEAEMQVDWAKFYTYSDSPAPTPEPTPDPIPAPDPQINPKLDQAKALAQQILDL